MRAGNRWLTIRVVLLVTIAVYLVPPLYTKEKGKQEKQELSPLEQFIRDAQKTPATASPSKGSIYKPGSPFEDLAADVRARNLHDVVTIVVSERASALARGTTKTSRSSDARSGIAALAGPTPASGALANLMDLSSERELDAAGSTSRETIVSTTLTARVTHVLPNGFLVVEGSKKVRVNEEVQTITIRGVVRPYDISPDNFVSSDRLALLEVEVNGKGIIQDTIKKPGFLYRLLTGLLPF